METEGTQYGNYPRINGNCGNERNSQKRKSTFFLRYFPVSTVSLDPCVVSTLGSLGFHGFHSPRVPGLALPAPSRREERQPTSRNLYLVSQVPASPNVRGRTSYQRGRTMVATCRKGASIRKLTYIATCRSAGVCEQALARMTVERNLRSNSKVLLKS